MSNAATLSLSFAHTCWLIFMGCCLNLSIGMPKADNHLEQDRAMRFAVIYTEDPPYAYSHFIPATTQKIGLELRQSAFIKITPTQY
jgi:hypothetical protein